MRTAGRQFYDSCRVSVFFALQFFVLQFALQCLRCKFFVQQLCLVVSLLVLQCFCAAVFWRCSFVAVQFLLRCSYFCVFVRCRFCNVVLFCLRCSVLCCNHVCAVFCVAFIALQLFLRCILFALQLVFCLALQLFQRCSFLALQFCALL